jgi:hypothetical protein
VSAKQPLERKVRWTLALIVAMIVAVPVLALWGYISKVADSKLVAEARPTDEWLVAIDGRTILFEPRELGRAMTDWLKLDKDRTLTFELTRALSRDLQRQVQRARPGFTRSSS